MGQAGDLSTETAALLSMEQVKDDDQFTPEVRVVLLAVLLGSGRYCLVLWLGR